MTIEIISSVRPPDHIGTLDFTFDLGKNLARLRSS